MDSIPFFLHDLGQGELESLARVLSGPILTTGDTVREFEEQFALALGQLAGRLHTHFDEQVALATSIENWHALVANPEAAAGLGSFRDFELVIALQGRHHNFGAQSGLGKRNGNHAAQIIALPLKERVFFHVQDNVKISRGTTERSGLAETGKTDARAVLDSSRNLGIHRAVAQHAALAFALRTRMRNHAARTLARWTGAGDAEESLLVANLTTSRTRPARCGSRARRRTRTLAVFADFVTPDRDFCLGAKNRLVELQREVFAQVGPALGASTPTPASAAKQISKPEKLTEDVAEILKHTGIKTRGPRAAAHTGMAEAVVE